MGKNFLRALVALGLVAGCSSTDPNGRDPLGGIGANSGGAVLTGGAIGSGGIVNGSGGSTTGGFMVPPTTTGGLVIDAEATDFVRDEATTSGLDPAVVDKLRNGGGACSNEIIYPYANTTFPGGLPTPPFMWNGQAEAAYIHVAYEGLTSVDYQFAVGGNPPELRIPPEAWANITARSKNSPLNVTLSFMQGGNVSTCQMKLNIAPGNMTGSIYYNTYNAPGVASPGNGAVMRLPLGQPMSEIYLQFQGPAVPVTGPCIACHSVSFDGSTIVASTHAYTPLAALFEVYKYDVTQATQPASSGMLTNANFGALTPKGDKMLAMGNPDCTNGADTFPRSKNNFPLVEGPDHARLLDTTTGQEIQAPGLDPEVYMWMPQFSPTGDKVVFNYARPDGAGGTNRRELAVMDFDDATNTFSNLRVIVSNIGKKDPARDYAPLGAGNPIPIQVPNTTCMSDPPAGVGMIPGGTCDGPCYPAYPFFTPDGKAVIFALHSEPDFASALPGRSVPAKGELWYVDLDSGNPIPLDNINRTLNPAEAQHEYYPTVLPVAIGGKFWVVWTSRRSFGHYETGDPAFPNPDEDPFRKRLWAAAIQPRDPSSELPPTGDPSSPGFYVEGQSASGNVRGFATLNPCKATGNTCQTGLDCCTGFCAVEEGATEGVCSEEKPACSKTNEKCETDADCCPPGLDEFGNMCIAGFCSFLTPTIE